MGGFEKVLIILIYLLPYILIVFGIGSLFVYAKKKGKVFLIVGIISILMGIYFGFFKSFGPIMKNRFQGDSDIDAKYINQHKKLVQMNQCNENGDCALIKWTSGLKCYYLIETKHIENAKLILMSIGTRSTVNCPALDIASGVVCINGLACMGKA